MILFPAIDLRGGKVVRLTKGDYDQMTVYADDPAQIAKEFYDQGARYLHVVDLDGAKDGRLCNYEAVRAITSAAPLFVEIGGGIRNLDRIERYLDTGVGRCILGTAAVNDPQFLKEALHAYGSAIAVGVDVRDGFVAVSGWLEMTQLDGFEFCRQLYDGGVSNVIYTDISRDGMLSGPNHDVYAQLAEIKGLQITASGGITTAEDIRQLAATDIYGAIVGKALYTGRLTLREGLEAAEC